MRKKKIKRIIKKTSIKAVRLLGIEWKSILPTPIPNNIIGNDLLLIFLFFINNIEKAKNNRFVNKFKGSAKKYRLFLSQ